jgi:putative Holliday junction resolvase
VTEQFPAEGRLAGIDFGTVRIGIAVTDSDRRLASPYENYTRRGADGDARYFRQLVGAENIVAFVVGLPVHGSGEESQKSIESRRFGQWLTEITGLPVRYYDERYTSVQAEQSLLGAQMTRKRRKKRLDMVAAQIMLAAYLESSQPGKPGPLGD